jgi:catalase
MFSYPDAARYRLGANYQQLPCNKALSEVYSPYQRDGAGIINGNYGADPDYVGSGFRKMAFRPHSGARGNEEWSGRMQSYATIVTDRDFEQSRELWHIIYNEEGGRRQFLENITLSLFQIVPKLCDKAIGELFTKSLRYFHCGRLTIIKRCSQESTKVSAIF